MVRKQWNEAKQKTIDEHLHEQKSYGEEVGCYG